MKSLNVQDSGAVASETSTSCTLMTASFKPSEEQLFRLDLYGHKRACALCPCWYTVLYSQINPIANVVEKRQRDDECIRTTSMG